VKKIIFRILFAFGILILLKGAFGFFRHVSNIEQLSEYGKGYVTGNAVLVIAGGLLIWYSLSRLSKL